MKVRIFLCFLFLLSSYEIFAQDTAALNAFDNHFDLANTYDSFSYYAECIEEINIALQLAKENEWKEKEIKLYIFLAEVKRKTEDNIEGLSFLYNLRNSIEYPLLHVKKLGRMAALYNEMPDIVNLKKNRDSVFHYLDSALHIASTMGLKAQQASLYNEMGYTLGAVNIDSSLSYLNKAAQLFADLKDTANYVVVKTNIMRTYTLQREYDKVESIVDELLHLIQLSSWNAMEVKLEFYRTLTFYYYQIGDSLKLNYWSLEKYKTTTEILKSASSTKLISFRALYETNKYKDDASKKEEQLIRATERRKEIVSYFAILALLTLGVVLLLFRERKLKKAVNKANEKYHMLIIESNHRIKNNLQMIISMLEYSRKDLGDKDSLAFKKISSKIQTISALHKHLYLDVHNEKVDLNSYFEDVISLYNDISNNSFKIIKKIDKLSIQSERIVYFGLIFNEMLSNTIEHSNSPNKTVHISVVKMGERFRLTYQDNSSFKLNSTKGIGTILIEQLVKRIEGNKFIIEEKTGMYQFEFYV